MMVARLVAASASTGNCCLLIGLVIRNALGEGFSEKTYQKLSQYNTVGVPIHGLGLERLILRGAKLEMS